VAVIIKVYMPPVVGMPSILPLEVSVRPVGKVPPVNVKVNRPVPPVALRNCRYSVLALAVGSVRGAIATAVVLKVPTGE
jgi:hypothetical protein